VVGVPGLAGEDIPAVRRGPERISGAGRLDRIPQRKVDVSDTI
jgi:hypothetical protein